ncbi:hypothetical protein MAUB1S_09000 [Mycolicibacterium aubagnense]
MLLRSTLIYGLASLLTRISALLLLVVMTRLIDQTEYGLLTLVVTVGEMTDVAVTNWLRIALLRLGGKGDVSRGSLILAGQVLLGSTILALLVSVIASAVVVPERWDEFAIAVSSYLVAGAIGRFALTVLQMQQRHSVYSALESLRGLLQFVLPIAAAVMFQPSFLTVSLGSSLGALIAGIAACIIAFRRVVTGPPRFTRKEFFALGVPLVVMALAGFGLNSAERIFLKIYYGAGAVANFAAIYVLARQPIDMIANAINMGAFPEVVSRFDEEGREASVQLLSQLMSLMIRLCLPVAAMLVALNSDITRLLLPKDYHGVSLLFPIIAFSVLCSNLTTFVYGGVIHAHKRPWLLIIVTSLGSIGTIALSLLLIPTMAETGAAFALAGGSLIALAACIIISGRLMPVPVPWRDIAFSIVISLVTGLAARLASHMLGDTPPIVSLAVGGTVGSVVFLGQIWLLHPTAVAQLLGKLRSANGSSSL